MNKIVISLVMFLVSFTNALSQELPSEIGRKKLEGKAINKIRKIFNISKDTQLFATVVFELIDSTQIYAKSPVFDLSRKINNYLEKSKIIHYEIYVYDSKLKNVYIVNRILLGEGIYKRDYYIAKKDDFIIAEFFLLNKYDYVLNLMDVPSQTNNIVLLCFIKDKKEIALFKDEIIKSIQVYNYSTFNFLNNTGQVSDLCR